MLRWTDQPSSSRWYPWRDRDARIPLGQTILTIPAYEPDFGVLRAASTRIVLTAVEDSTGELGNRGAFAVAERLGIEPVIFPSDHCGFLGGEYGQTGKPEAFAAKLRDVLQARVWRLVWLRSPIRRGAGCGGTLRRAIASAA